MGFQVGFQTTLSSFIQCQGMEVLLDGSMQKGIVQHTEYVVTEEEEIFTKNHEHLIARSSSEKLKCNPHGPSLGCVGALHTYAWNLPKTSCLFRKVRELEGVFTTWLRYYTKQVTSSIIHAVCRNDKVCDLNPLSETLI